MDFLDEVFAAEEVAHTTPRIENSTFGVSDLGVEVFFQASNTDANFKQLGVVKALKAKHSVLWDFSSGML